MTLSMSKASFQLLLLPRLVTMLQKDQAYASKAIRMPMERYPMRRLQLEVQQQLLERERELSRM